MNHTNLILRATCESKFVLSVIYGMNNQYNTKYQYYDSKKNINSNTISYLPTIANKRSNRWNT